MKRALALAALAAFVALAFAGWLAYEWLTECDPLLTLGRAQEHFACVMQGRR